MDLINWPSLERFLQKQTEHKRNKLVQMMHNWQNTGAQKIQFLPKVDGVTVGDMTIGECPVGCGQTEHAMHYVHCPEVTMRQCREAENRRVSKQLGKCHTYKGIISVITKAIVQLETSADLEFEIRDFRGEEGHWLALAIQDQAKIGWIDMLQGFISAHWGKCQDSHLRHQGLLTRKVNADTWSVKFLATLIDLPMNCWQRRNDILHGKECDKQRKRMLERCKKTVRKLYGHARNLRKPEDKEIFKVPKYKRLKQGLVGLRRWIEVAETTIRCNREEQAKNTLDLWLSSRSGAPHNP